VHVISHANGRLGSSNRGLPVSEARLSQDDRERTESGRRFGEYGVDIDER
jgi:hypothetical protein